MCQCNDIPLTIADVNDYQSFSLDQVFGGAPCDRVEFNTEYFCFNISARDDGLAEGNETFFVVLRSNDSAVAFNISTATVTIVDNEGKCNLQAQS